MTAVIENAAKLLQTIEVRLGRSYTDPYDIRDTEEVTKLQVTYALPYNPIIKLQLRISATKEAPPWPI